MLLLLVIGAAIAWGMVQAAAPSSVTSMADIVPDERLDRAILLFRTPYRGDCPALGAIEAGRRVVIVEQRPLWTMIDAVGSGRVWIRSPEARLTVDGRLTRTVIAYAHPWQSDAATPLRCSTLLGVANPGAPYQTRHRAGQWSLIAIDDLIAWTDALP